MAPAKKQRGAASNASQLNTSLPVKPRHWLAGCFLSPDLAGSQAVLLPYLRLDEGNSILVDEGEGFTRLPMAPFGSEIPVFVNDTKPDRP